MTDFKKFDKQIYYVKVIIWEACPLRCTYCFVDKEKWRSISLSSLKKLVELLMYSPGQNKLLHLLGGEPLLYFHLIKEAVPYARKLEKETGKQLDISFCTSGIWFSQEKLEFIAEQNIYLAWSIDWPEYIHDRNRNYKWGENSFKNVIWYKNLVLQNIKDTHLWIAMTVDSNTTVDLFESYKYLVDTEWFNCTINIAPVDWKLWEKNLQVTFIKELQKVYDYIFENIWKGRFLYLNALNKEFRFQMLSAKNKGRCLWFYTEAFSNGDIVFNPFINKEEDYSKYVAANIDDEDFLEKVDKYIGCKFDNDSQLCSLCRYSYFEDSQKDLKIIQMNKLLWYRDRLSVFYANKIRIAAKNSPEYALYIEKAKDYMYV